MLLMSFEQTIRRPSGDQVPAAFGLQQPPASTRRSVPSALARKRHGPQWKPLGFSSGQPAARKVTRSPSGESEPLPVSSSPLVGARKTVLLPPATGATSNTGALP